MFHKRGWDKLHPLSMQSEHALIFINISLFLVHFS